MVKEQAGMIKRMIRAVMKGMVHAKSHRDEMIPLLMSKSRLERERAAKTWDLTARTLDESGSASESAVLLSIQGALEMLREKKEVPLSQVVDFSLARQAYQELKQK